MADTVTAKVRGSHFHEGRLVRPGEEITVSKDRHAELVAVGVVENPNASDAPSEWTNSLGEKVPHTGWLQEVGRPNAEPPPGSDSPTPGTGELQPVHEHEYLKPGETNPEPPAGSDSPPPGSGEVVAAGPAMVVENPASMIPPTEGLIERSAAPVGSSGPTEATGGGSPLLSASVRPVDEARPEAPEEPLKRGYVRRKDR